MAGNYSQNDKPLSGVYSKVIGLLEEKEKKEHGQPGGGNGGTPPGQVEAYFLSPWQPM